jgi:FMN hydrolase / 5-amino-6-(5-phospho-D-ribitylamino)uracil phosphatase
MIAAVTFDADGTLWDFERVMREALTLVVGALQAHAPDRAADLSVERMIAIREQVAAEPALRGASLEQVRLASFERALVLLGRPDPELASRLAAIYLRHRFERICLYDDVVSALDTLATHRPVPVLDLVSNGNTDPERCGLPHRFQFALFAHHHGVKKPDRRFFEMAVREAGCDPSRIVHVGDSLENDVAGAQALGMRAVWLNRERLPNTTTIVPDAEIVSLSELPAVCRV